MTSQAQIIREYMDTCGPEVLAIDHDVANVILDKLDYPNKKTNLTGRKYSAHRAIKDAIELPGKTEWYWDKNRRPNAAMRITIPPVEHLSMFSHVVEMHDKFDIPSQTDKDHDFILFRTTAMQEELVEFQRAVLKNNRVAQLDALVDLCVFLFGTADLLEFTEEQFTTAFRRVMDANMSKELAGTGTNSKRGWEVDLVKPDGWKAADLEDLI